MRLVLTISCLKNPQDLHVKDKYSLPKNAYCDRTILLSAHWMSGCWIVNSWPLTRLFLVRLPGYYTWNRSNYVPESGLPETFSIGSDYCRRRCTMIPDSRKIPFSRVLYLSLYLSDRHFHTFRNIRENNRVAEPDSAGLSETWCV